MNIFAVLSTGKSNIHEPSMSAMLAYLLNPHQDHGLGRKVMERFLDFANKEKGLYGSYIADNSLRFEIDLEVQYKNEGKRNDIDIQIKVLDKSYNELHRIIIENKIKSGAANPKQLKSYYDAVLADKENDDPFELNENNLSVIFLTPKKNHKGLREEYDNLDINNKVWLYWNSEDSEEASIVKLIQDLLKLEQNAQISPINDYMRHTLKAFTYYIIKTINISTGKNRAGEDIGELKFSKEISIGNNIFTLLLRDSGQIQLLNQDGDKERARPFLRQFLKENNIPEKENCQTTRCFGNQIIKYLDGVI